MMWMPMIRNGMMPIPADAAPGRPPTIAGAAAAATVRAMTMWIGGVDGDDLDSGGADAAG
jgi:hypothetical protein